MRKITIEIPDGVEIEIKGGKYHSWIELGHCFVPGKPKDIDCREILDKATAHLDFSSRKE